MALTTFDYEIEWIVMLLVTLYFTDTAWFGHRTFAGQGREIGYATILTWIRATGFMILSGILWLFMAELTVAFNAGVNSFASAGQGSILAVFPYVCVGLFFLHIVMGIVITAYLVLPTEKLPKAFQYFQKRPEGYEK